MTYIMMRTNEEILNHLYRNNNSDVWKINKDIFEEPQHSVYGESKREAVDYIVDNLKEYFNKDTVFYDFGSGAGKMVIHLGVKYGIKKSVGIELSPERHSIATQYKKNLCPKNKIIEFKNQDFTELDVSDATVIYCDNTMFYLKEETKKWVGRVPNDCLIITRKPIITIKKTKVLSSSKLRTNYNSEKVYYFIKNEKFRENL